jgi:hypothetical protein
MMNLNELWKKTVRNNNDEASSSSNARSRSPVYFAEEASPEIEYESRVSDALTRQASLSTDSEVEIEEQNDLVNVC